MRGLRSIQRSLQMETRHVRSGKISPRNPRLAGGQLPAGDAAADDLGRGYVLGRPQHQILLRAAARLVRADARQGLDRAALAEGIWRRRPRRRADQDRAPGDGRDRRASAADLVRHLHARAGAVEIRHRGAEEGTSAEDRRRPDPLVPGLFRAERRLRPRLAADPRRQRRRRLRHQRPEDLDLLRELRRLDLLPGAHRCRRQEA